MPDRPQDFRIDYQSPLAKGLVFAGLGRHVKSLRYTDSSLLKNTGTLTGMVPSDDWTWVQELGRWGLDFDGSNDAIEIPYQSAANTEATYACWINITADIAAVAAALFIQRAGSIGWVIALTSAEKVYVYDNAARTSTNAVPIGEYAHIAIARRGANFEFFLNGAANGVVAGGTEASGATMRFGHYASWGNYPLLGVASDILIHNRALSLPEVATLANPSDPVLGGLVLPPARKWWPVVSGGGEPPIFKAAWARKTNNLIGSGVA